MKLFQSLLVAPAAIGLLSSISVSATELNIKDASRYSQVASIPTFDQIYETDWVHKALSDIAKSRGCLGQIPEGNISRIEAATILNKCVTNVAQLSYQEERLISEFNSELALLNGKADELDSRLSEFEAGSFSTTTSASFSADFAFGAVDGNTSSDKASLIYGYQIDLSTSFTGEDSLDVSLDAGSGSSTSPLQELDFNGTGDALTVDGIAYTFPLGEKLTVFFGDSMDGSTLYNTACVYGGQTNTLDDCGNANSAMAAGYGSAAGASYDFGNGLIASIGYEGQGSTDSNGLMTKEGADVFGGQLSYTGDMYGVSLTYASMETVDSSSNVVSNGDTTYWGFNGYIDPEGDDIIPSISVGYETGDSETSGTSETYHWFVGVQWDDLASGTLGAALGTTGHTSEDADEYLMYEAYYSYAINDGVTITPLIYIVDQPAGTDDETGLIVKTSFSF